MKKNILKGIQYLFIIISIVISVYFSYKVYELKLIPTKYLIVGFLIIVFFNLLITVFLLKKKKVCKGIGIFCSILLLSMMILGIHYIEDTNNFLNTLFNNNIKEINTYHILVLKNSSYDDIYKLNKKDLGFMLEEKNKEEVLLTINEYITADSIEYEDIYEIYNDLLNKKIEAILIDSAYEEVLREEDKEFDEKIKTIYSFDIETTLYNETESNELRSINIYISGSDARTSTINNKSRSDVNMILTINPTTKEVLMTSIPRDYYIQVHGQTGLKDKLTHAGIYGLKVSESTLEDVFDIEIDYSVKVNFNALVEVVDLIGGIDVYSDITFSSSHKKGWIVNKGWNHMDGKEALAYARERYAYKEGDRHRIKNQQQVLEATMKKILKDKTTLLKYDEVLTSLNKLYKTTIPKEVITLFVRNQLDTMSSWNFEALRVSGSDASLPTHTAPNSKRYVMIPYEEDIKKAHDKIIETLKSS